MPHVHLSLQSGDNMILKRMKRRHSRELAVDLVARMKSKRPEIAIGADIIAGFPTEDDAMFENSMKLISDCDIVHGHIFPYSPKEGTPAAKMPQVDRRVIKNRSNQLRAAVTHQFNKWQNSLIGSTQSLLTEKSGQKGHGENFAFLHLDKPIAAGQIARVEVTGLINDKLQAKVI